MELFKKSILEEMMTPQMCTEDVMCHKSKTWLLMKCAEERGNAASAPALRAP